MIIIYYVTLALLSVAALLTLLRTIHGPSVLDRIISLDIVAILLVSGTVVADAMAGTNEHVALIAAIALLGFTGTVTATRLVERHGG